MNKIIMIMGIQRSGSSALFSCLEQDKNITSFNESENNDFFKNWILRPLRKIEMLIKNINTPILLKPVHESWIRNVKDVFEEYKDYDIHVIWLYRDPVNVYYSFVLKEGMGIKFFINYWTKRNKRILSALPKYGSNITLIKYEDLISDKQVFFDFCKFLNIKGKYLFRKDSLGGRKNLSKEVQLRIEKKLNRLFEELDDNRRFRAFNSNISTKLCLEKNRVKLFFSRFFEK